MADIKSLLKEARKLIDDKNYEEAQECCKAILRKDKQNYYGLVLLGKCLQDSDQAPLAYQKAIASKPDQPLAWQGLANYYERIDDNHVKAKLFAIYHEILNLQIEDEKAQEIIGKLGQLGSSLKSSESIGILVKYLNKSTNMKLREVAEKQLINILNADVVCNEEDIQPVLDILSNACNKDPNDSIDVLCGKIILQKSDFASAVKEVVNLRCFPKNVLLREYLCKYLCKRYVDKESFNSFPIENYVHTLTEGVENSKYPALLKSMICYEQSMFVDAYKQCVPLINYHDADVTEATFIIRCTIKLQTWSKTQNLATNFLTKFKDQAFCVELRKFLFLSLAKQQNWKQAIAVAKDISPHFLSVNDQAILAECCIEANEPADILLKNLQHTEYYKQLQALVLMKQEKYCETVSLLENTTENTLNLFYLAKAYWELKHYDKCHINLLKAAKLDTEHAFTFLYLGHFYHYHKEDLYKAKKCYEKAYSINNTNSDIARYLSELYIKLELEDANFELLSSALKNIQTKETWINLRLGLHYYNRRDWENAIVNFRNVMKYDPNNLTATECLADAYYSRGSFTSALRAYNKIRSTTLNPNQLSHCLSRIGNIYTLLTQYEDAISIFEEVLKTDPHSHLALNGISETWMEVAKKNEAAKMYGRAKDCAQYAVNYITKAISEQKDFLCFWKLLADALIFITKLPDKYSFVYIKKSYQISDEEVIRTEKLDVFLYAISCYAYIVKQNQQKASYDLASAYLDYYHATKNMSNCNIAYHLIIICIKENPSVWRNWDLLGKICFFLKRYNVAQHSFIKALLLIPKGSGTTIWCNLGTLYLKLKSYKLANYCFWRGQSTLPSYPQSWIGQALIAEEVREEEAMDLFRHASRLGYHPESALGYAYWVCHTLKNEDYKNDPEFKYVIDDLYAITYAKDLMEWFCTFEPNNVCACTILGILQERCGLLQSALKSHKRALQYVEDDKKNIAMLNVGRLLIGLEKYDEAINVYKAITEASFNSTIGLALALFKKGLYEESYSVYDTALHWLSNDDDEKAEVLVAMAATVYMLKGADDAKTILFHSIQTSRNKPTPYGLFAICSLGIIHSDQSLSKLALSELQKYEKNRNFAFDIGFLKSYLLVCQDNMEDAVKLLSDSLHDHPSNALLWFCMAQYLLRASSSRARAASCCAQRALCSAQYGEYNCHSANMIANASVAEHIAGNRVKAFRLAKKGLHMYPHQAEIWAALLLSVSSHKMWKERKDWMLSAARHMRRHLDISRPLSRWVSLLERKLSK